MHNWLIALLFFLPAGVANATPVFANRIPVVNRWKTPVDFGLSWRGRRLLGSNKTWRGIFTGTLLAGLTGLLLFPLTNSGESRLEIFGISLLMGFGALLGDAIESFLKRQRGVPAGHSWFPFDQIDYIIGGLLIISPFAEFSFGMLGLIFITYFGLHLLVAYCAFLVGLKDRPI
jgi:CDP-2,3-bis-(O-geranylgeranyl)-sn-glycerol synthase